MREKTWSHSRLFRGPRELTAPPLSSWGFVSVSLVGQCRFGRQLAPAAPPALDDDGDQVGLLHRPHFFDQLWDGNRVRLLDAKQHERLGDVVGQLSLVMQVELFEALQNVIQAAQSSP